MPDWKAKITQYEDEYLKDLETLISIPSVRDLESAGDRAPFGSGIRKVFDCFLEIAEKCGFNVEDCDGYACHAQAGAPKEYVGVLGHLDVVGILQPEKWDTPPYQLIRKGDMLYGRGVNDDKGPLLAALYAARIVMETGSSLKRSIRIIAGGAEETTWECMEYYFNRHAQPALGFSPDGNFPIVNGEKGIQKYELLFPTGINNPKGDFLLKEIHCSTLENYVCSDMRICIEQNGKEEHLHWEGISALSRNPQRGKNVLWDFANAFAGQTFVQPEAEHSVHFILDCLTNDYYGKKIGLYAEDEKMGTTSVCPTGIRMGKAGISLYLDIRYPKSTNEKNIDRHMEELSRQYGFQLIPRSRKRLLYVPEDSELILSLKKSYQRVTGEDALAFTKGGASYARTMDCGVAFGATFDGEETHPHMPNECMSFSSIRKAMEIYCESLWNLAVEC